MDLKELYLGYQRDDLRKWKRVLRPGAYILLKIYAEYNNKSTDPNDIRRGDALTEWVCNMANKATKAL